MTRKTIWLAVLFLFGSFALAQAETAAVPPGIYFLEKGGGIGAGETPVAIGEIRTAKANSALHYRYQIDGRLQEAILAPDDAVRIGRPLSIRGRKLLPITVSPRLGERVVQSATLIYHGNLLTPEDVKTDYPKSLCLITTEAIVQGSSKLATYLEHKTSLGWTVITATETDWDVSTGDAADARADRIRAWLAANYESLEIGYVLLIGDPDPELGDIPMKMTNAIQNVCDAMEDPVYCSMAQSPSDAYYADLEGDWDLNGDGRFAEYPEDMEEGGVDLGPEVLVGRLPLYDVDYSALDDMLEVAMSVDDHPTSAGRRRVLLPGAILGIDDLKSHEIWDGAEVIDVIGRDLTDRDDQLKVVRLYEKESLAPSSMESDLDLNVENVIRAWQTGAGLAIWYGHGGTQSAHRFVWLNDADQDDMPDEEEMDYPVIMSAWDAPELQGATPAFVFQISCENGHPEDHQNLGAMILRYGAAGTIAASRSTLGESAYDGEWEPSPYCAAAATKAYYYADHLVAGWPVGQAMAHLRYGFSFEFWDQCAPPEWYGGADTTSLGWLMALQLNLYGDPTLSYAHADIPADDDDDDNDNDDDNDDNHDLADDDSQGDDDTIPLDDDDDDDDDDSGCGC